MSALRVLIRLVIILIIVLALSWLLVPKQDSRILQVGKYQCIDKNTNGICDFQEKQISTPAKFEISHKPAGITFDIPGEPSSAHILQQIQEDAIEQHKLTQPYLRELEERVLEEQENRQNLYRTSGGEIIYYEDWNWYEDTNDDT